MVVSSRHPPKFGTYDSDRQCSFSPSRFSPQSGLPNPRTEMQGGARIRQWRAVPADERSPASLVVATRIRSGRTARGDATPVQHPPGTDLCSGAAVLIATLADQTSLPWPDEFPRKIQRTEKPEAD